MPRWQPFSLHRPDYVQENGPLRVDVTEPLLPGEIHIPVHVHQIKL